MATTDVVFPFCCGLSNYDESSEDDHRFLDASSDEPQSNDDDLDQPSNRYRIYKGPCSLYPVYYPRVLRSPFQHVPQARQNLFIYTWQLPPPATFAMINDVHPDCFGDTSRTIGLVFSRPISEADIVCRLPLYLGAEIVRVQVRSSGMRKLSHNDMSVLQEASQVLSHLARDPNGLDAFPSFSKFRSMLKYSSPMNGLTFHVHGAGICGYLAIIQTDPDIFIDMPAMRALVEWSYGLSQPLPKLRYRSVTRVNGVVPRFAATVAHIKRAQGGPEIDSLRGLVVRFNKDPSFYAVHGMSSDDDTVTVSHITPHPNAMLANFDHTTPTRNDLRLSQSICFAYPLSAWLWQCLCLTPAVVHQLTRCLSGAELSMRLSRLPSPHQSEGIPDIPIILQDRAGENANLISGESVHESGMVLDGEAIRRRWTDSRRVDPGQIVEATTAGEALDAVSMDRYRCLGMSFVKFVSTLYVFYPSDRGCSWGATNGDMHAQRVCFLNTNWLLRTAQDAGLLEYIFVDSPAPETWLPPGYVFGNPQTGMTNPHGSKYICDRCGADVVEAILGCFLKNASPEQTANLIDFMIRKVDSPQPRQFPKWKDSWLNMLIPKRLRSVENVCDGIGDAFRVGLDRYDTLQRDVLKYQFRKPALLVKATLQSRDQLTGFVEHYKRLEFFGDAILDFVLMDRLLQQYDDYSLANRHWSFMKTNLNLSIVCVRAGISQLILTNNENLRQQHSEFVCVAEMEDYSPSKIKQKYPDQSSYKVLADVVEAIIGAVYVDCAGHQPTIESVVSRLMAFSAIDDQVTTHGRRFPGWSEMKPETKKKAGITGGLLIFIVLILIIIMKIFSGK